MNEPINFQPSTPTRSTYVYVSWELSQMLKYAAKKEECTREDLFEKVQMEYLQSKHPEIVKWVQERAEAEKAFVKLITEKKP